MQQLYGGEISDHFKVRNVQSPTPADNLTANTQQLGDVYNAKVKPVGQVVVTNSPTNINMNALIERQPDPLILQLQNTLAKIAQEYNLTSDKHVNNNFEPSLRDQTDNDLQQANDAVLKALEELKSLGVA
jgi:hypothetical protein